MPIEMLGDPMQLHRRDEPREEISLARRVAMDHLSSASSQATAIERTMGIHSSHENDAAS